MVASRKKHLTGVQETLLASTPWIIMGLFFLIGAHALVLQFQDPPSFDLQIIHPEIDDTFAKGSRVYFRVSVSEPGTYEFKLFLKKGGTPGSGDLVGQSTTTVTDTYSYPVNTSSLSTGEYYWFIRAKNTLRHTEESPVGNFTLTSASSESDGTGSSVLDATSVSISSEGLGSCTGGPGGHESSPTGEKTFRYQILQRGESYDLRFNKVDVHGIERITITALATLWPNGVIIHQELKKIVTLPSIENLYKVYDVQLTFPIWGNEDFYSTIQFRFPKTKLLLAHQPQNVSLLVYTDGKWAPIPTSFVREEAEYYVYSATLRGFPPFAIGSCAKTWNGFLIP